MHNRGFTLIELLVVIAVLSILAGITVIAVNPTEQIAKLRDAGRISAVTQLGSAISRDAADLNFYPIPGPGNADTMNTADWQTYLISRNQIRTPYKSTINQCAIFLGANIGQAVQYNICYQSDGTNAYVFTLLESRFQTNKCIIGGVPHATWAVWTATRSGRTEIGCVNGWASPNIAGVAVYKNP